MTTLRAKSSPEQWHTLNPESPTLDPTSGTETGRYVLNPEPA
jgi:hypothetical protein